jgi:hypothetical protein
MKKKGKSKFDILVERLIEEFSKIPNFDLISSDSQANEIFNKVIFRIADVVSYKDLVCQHFIPATNKAIFDAKEDFQKSQYSYLLKNKDLDFKETLYETTRLAYVGLFHKLENYINDMIDIPDIIFGEIFEKEGTVAEWAKEKFSFDFKNWHQFKITFKINWVCNCVKHKDGFPIKEPKPIEFINLDQPQRIKISPEEFKKDCEILIKFYIIYLQAMYIFATHKMAFEKPINKEDYKHSPDLYDKQIENLSKLELGTKRFVELLNVL